MVPRRWLLARLGIGNRAGLDLVADAGVVGGIIAWDAGICEGETEKSGRLVFADFSGDAKWFAGQSIVVNRSALRAGENFADVVCGGHVIGHA